MQLPQTAEYALRAMAYLATLPRGHGLTSQALSEHTGIPVAYLSKILRRLVVAGLLRSQKGHGGGFSLLKAPQHITFKAILSAVDCEAEAGRCAFGWGECNPRVPCPLHDAWTVLNGAFQEWASDTTLACAREWPHTAETRRRR